MRVSVWPNFEQAREVNLCTRLLDMDDRAIAVDEIPKALIGIRIDSLYIAPTVKTISGCHLGLIRVRCRGRAVAQLDAMNWVPLPNDQAYYARSTFKPIEPITRGRTLPAVDPSEMMPRQKTTISGDEPPVWLTRFFECVTGKNKNRKENNNGTA